MAAMELSAAERKSLCDAAEAAMKALGPSQRVARFGWQGMRFKASRTNFRLLVDTEAGEPVVCRYD